MSANLLMLDLATGALTTELTTSGRSAKALHSDATIADGKWRRVGFAWDGTNRRLYVDGVLAAGDAQDSLMKSFVDLIIGDGKSMVPGTFWSGLIDNLWIYGRVVKPWRLTHSANIQEPVA